MGNPDKMDTKLTRTLLKQSVHTVERLAAHVLPQNDHVCVELVHELPKVIQQDLVAAVCAVAHDHLFGEHCNVVNRLLAVLRRILLGDHFRIVHGQHICQRNNAPAVEQPDQEVHIKV